MLLITGSRDFFLDLTSPKANLNRNSTITSVTVGVLRRLADGLGLKLHSHLVLNISSLTGAGRKLKLGIPSAKQCAILQPLRNTLLRTKVGIQSRIASTKISALIFPVHKPTMEIKFSFGLVTVPKLRNGIWILVDVCAVRQIGTSALKREAQTIFMTTCLFGTAMVAYTSNGFGRMMGGFRNKSYEKYIGVIRGCNGVYSGDILELYDKVTGGGNCEGHQKWVN